MEVPQEAVPIGSHKDQQDHQIMVKGKRNKRQRQQSPIPFTLATSSSPIRESGDDYHITGQNNNNTNSNSSPATSALVYQDSTEEEDIAQGHHSREHYPPKQLDGNAKFTRRRYLEAATGTGRSKAVYYVYECKTCGQTFPSFQAMGGHRASHKKPKSMAAAKRQLMFSSSDDEDTQSHLPSLSLQLSNRSSYNTNNNNNNNKSSKSHDCSICGVEFTSGQALGGHMRRHRGSLITTTSTALSSIPMASGSEELHAPKKPRNVLSFDLDLNLPAPDNYHHRPVFNFPIASNQQKLQQQQQQKTQLVLSSHSLVDCHY